MFTLGSFKGGMAYPLRGAMDNVRVYGRALDLTEIVGIYEKEIIR